MANVRDKTPCIVHDGIEVHVGIEDFDDFRITECLGSIMDDSVTDAEKAVSIVRLTKTVLKGDYERVQGELRERGGGRLTNQAMLDFVFGLMREAGAKNS